MVLEKITPYLRHHLGEHREEEGSPRRHRDAEVERTQRVD
jgi:hypothetical protein